MYYEDVFLEFNNKKVRYLVVGGVAVNLYGVPRMTMDLDLMVEMSKNNLLNLIGVLENLGYKPKVPVRATDFVDPEKRIRWQKEKIKKELGREQDLSDAEALGKIKEILKKKKREK